MPNLNSLTPFTEIMSVAKLVNDANAAGTAEIAPTEFYSQQLLDTIRMDVEEYVYYRLADVVPIQNKSGKLVLRRWAPLRAHTTPLAEGIPPKSDKGSVEKYEITTNSYGRYMEFSDRVDFEVVDPIVAHYTREYGIVAIETMDMLARDTLFMVAQPYFAGGGTSMDDMTLATGPSLLDLRKIILNMKDALIKPRSNGNFHVIGSQAFYFDMISDPTVEKYMQFNQTTKMMYEGGRANIVPLFDMEFYESREVPRHGGYVDADGNKRLKIFNSAGQIGTSDGSGDGGVVDLIETNAAHYSIVDGYENDSRTGVEASYIPDQEIWSVPDGYYEFKVEHTLIVGKDALLRTAMQGKDKVQTFVKPIGSAGTLDPINQRQSIGFKIDDIGFGSVRPEAVWDYINVPSLLNV